MGNSVGRIKLRNSTSSWQSLTSNSLLLNLRCMAGHIMRERNIYDFNSGFDLYKKNMGTCGDTLMNGHWPPFSQHILWWCCNHLGIPFSTTEILLFNLVFHDRVTPVSVSTLKPLLRVIGVFPLKP